MEVHFNVPDDLARRIEYIPKQVLPEVLVNVFRAGVKRMTESVAERQEQGTVREEWMLESILEVVKAMQENSSIHLPARPEMDAIPVRQEAGMGLQTQKEKQIKAEPVVQIEEDDEDLGELLGMMK